MADDLNWNEFLSLSFSHHIEIITKTTTIEERRFYIHECSVHAWSKYILRDYIRSNLYQNRTSLPNNFDHALTDTQYAIKATKSINFPGASTQTPQGCLPPASQERGIRPNLATLGASLRDAEHRGMYPPMIQGELPAGLHQYRESW